MSDKLVFISYKFSLQTLASDSKETFSLENPFERYKESNISKIILSHVTLYQFKRKLNGQIKRNVGRNPGERQLLGYFNHRMFFKKLKYTGTRSFINMLLFVGLKTVGTVLFVGRTGSFKLSKV